MSKPVPGVGVVLRRPKNETPEHWAAKMHAWVWLWRHGCRHIGFEVEVNARWKVDVLGMVFTRGRSGAIVYAVEAKGHRADWLADLNAAKAGLAAFERLRAVHADALAAGVAEPTYYVEPIRPKSLQSEEERRRGEIVARYQKARRAVGKHGHVAGEYRRQCVPCGVDQAEWDRVVGAGPGLRFFPFPTKVACKDLARVTSARYVMAPPGVVLPEERPDGWGILEPGPRTVHKIDKPQPVSDEVAVDLLRKLALAQTYRTKAAIPGEEHGTDIRIEPFDDIVRREQEAADA
jgi:hypothetical protein